MFDALDAFKGDEAAPTVANIALSSGVGQQRTRTVLNLLK